MIHLYQRAYSNFLNLRYFLAVVVVSGFMYLLKATGGFCKLIL